MKITPTHLLVILASFLVYPAFGAPNSATAFHQSKHLLTAPRPPQGGDGSSTFGLRFVGLHYDMPAPTRPSNESPLLTYLLNSPRPSQGGDGSSQIGLVIAFTASAAESPQKDTNAPPRTVGSHWDYKTLTASFGIGHLRPGPGDSRYDKMKAEGWELVGYDIQPAWYGGANRSARYQILFRRKKR